MSSIEYFRAQSERGCVIAEWRKHGGYVVTGTFEGAPLKERFYAFEQKAVAAAKRRARFLGIKEQRREDWPRDENGLRLNPDLFLDRTQDEPLLQHYQMLHDGLSDMIEDGRITGGEADIQWLVRMLVNATTISRQDAEDAEYRRMLASKREQ